MLICHYLLSATDMKLWDGLHVPNAVLWALKDQGFTTPTQIQARALPSAIRDRMDVVGAAETVRMIICHFVTPN